MPPAPPYPHLDWKETRWTGVRLAFLDGSMRGEGADASGDADATGGARVLIHMAPGCAYPRHRHVGTEEVFVVAGSYRDAAGEYSAGSLQRRPHGSVHHPVAGPEGALLLAAVDDGIEVLEDAPSGA